MSNRPPTPSGPGVSCSIRATLAWLAHHERIVVTIPIGSWLGQLATQVRTIPVTPAIASAAVSLPLSFPGDPADRLIYATAIENGWPLVTKDEKLRKHRHPHPVAVWQGRFSPPSSASDLRRGRRSAAFLNGR